MKQRSLNLITGYAGVPHVTSAQQGAYNAATYGNGRYVFNIGNQFAYEIISNNLIRIKDGYAINQGRFMGIDNGDYEELVIDNGLQGVKRSDLVVMRYEKNKGTGIETATMIVIKGTSSDSYIDPEYESGDILHGDDIDDFPLYRVNIDGLNIDSIQELFPVTGNALTGDTANNTVTFTSGDSKDAKEWTEVELIESKEKHSALLHKISTMIKNFRYAYKVLSDHVNNEENPHKISKGDVGLGSVPNRTTNNQTPTFEKATGLTNIKSGETLSVLFGKIQNYFEKLKTVAFTGSYEDISNKPFWEDITDQCTFPDTVSDHSKTKVYRNETTIIVQLAVTMSEKQTSGNKEVMYLPDYPSGVDFFIYAITNNATASKHLRAVVWGDTGVGNSGAITVSGDFEWTSAGGLLVIPLIGYEP